MAATAALVVPAVRAAPVPHPASTLSVATAATPGPVVTVAAASTATRELSPGSTAPTAATVARAVTAVTPASAASQAWVAVARLRAVWVRMEPPVTVVAQATAASAVTVSTVFPALPQEIVEPRAVTPVTVATAERSVRPVPVLVAPTVRAGTAATPV
jgi:hypothetical protein